MGYSETMHIRRLHRIVQNTTIIGDDDGDSYGQGPTACACGRLTSRWSAWQGSPLNPETQPLCLECFPDGRQPEAYKSLWDNTGR